MSYSYARSVLNQLGRAEDIFYDLGDPTPIEEVLTGPVYVLTNNPVLLDQKTNLKAKLAIGKTELHSYLKRAYPTPRRKAQKERPDRESPLEEKGVDAEPEEEPEVQQELKPNTFKKFAYDLKQVIDNPELHNLSEAEVAELLAAVYVITGNENLDPENLLDYQEKLKHARQELGEILSDDTYSTIDVPSHLSGVATSVSQLRELSSAGDAQAIANVKNQLMSSVRTVANKTATLAKVAARKGLSRVAGMILSKVAMIGGPVGAAISLAITKLAKFFKTRGKEGGGGMLLVGGLLLGGPIGLAVAAAGIILGNKTLRRIAYVALSLIFSLVVAALAAPIIMAVVSTIAMLVIIIFIITAGAFVVPPSEFTPGAGGGGSISPVPSDCQTDDVPRPAVSGVRFSSDGRYAFPIAPFSGAWYTCGHWDGTLAADMMSQGTRLPLVAYTSGTVQSVSRNDPLGGKYVILAGDDGRYYYYAHACNVFVDSGQRVGVGELLATSDSTGLNAAVTPEHLHFAINSNRPAFCTVVTASCPAQANVCPATDFQDKFGITRCSADQQCP